MSQPNQPEQGQGNPFNPEGANPFSGSHAFQAQPHHQEMANQGTTPSNYGEQHIDPQVPNTPHQNAGFPAASQTPQPFPNQQQQPGQQQPNQQQPGQQQQQPQPPQHSNYGAPTEQGAPAHQGENVSYNDGVPGILDPRTGEVMPVPNLNQLQDTDALLVVVSGPDAGAQILLDTDVVTVGRSPNADIFLDDVTVSRKHAEFVRTPSGFTLRDTGSLNGTYVSRQLIDSIELRNGADVQIGKFRMIFQQRPRQ